jgi:hypothetical protein
MTDDRRRFLAVTTAVGIGTLRSAKSVLMTNTRMTRRISRKKRSALLKT